jgi:predicted nucleotidyltransferase
MSARSHASPQQILAGAGIRFAYLFGSRALGAAHPDSDADIAVMPSREIGLLAQGGLVVDLAVALGVSEVDLVMVDHASLELRGRIVREGRVLYSADEPARVAFEVRTLSEYLDWVPTLRILERSRLTHIAKHGL